MRSVAAFLVSLLAAAALTPLVILLARRQGLVAQPKADRWHSKPTALFGGVAIAIAFLLPAAFLTRFYNPEIRLRIAGVLVGAAFMFFIGMLDDLLHLKPTSKLIGQIIAACLLVWCGVYFDILGMPLLTIPLTIFWVVGITNAFNLLDNMDGLSAGVAAIAALTIFALNAVLGIDSSIGAVALSFAGALVGFLIYNFNPARIFMGDCGSMMIGFTLAGLSIAGAWQQASNLFFILAVPVLILGVPIFDTAFVSVTRRLRGQPVSVGGRDHTSHRLVALGLSERRAVVLLYGVCFGFGALAVLSLRYDAVIVGTGAALAAIVLVVFGMFLAQDRLYRDVTPASPGSARARPAGREHGFVFGTFIMHKRRMVEVLLDLVLFGISFVAAWLLRFEGILYPSHEGRLLFALPILIAIKLVTFWSFGLYRRLWAFMGVHDLVILARAVLTSSLLSVFTLWGLTRLAGYSRAVFVLDGLLLLFFAAGTRILFRVFQETLTTSTEEGRRLLIVGAGQAGEILLREVRRDRSLGYHPIGFVDDDRDKQGRRLHGVRILGGREHILRLAGEEAFDEIVIAIPSLDPDERVALVDLCRATGKTTRVMQPVSTTFLQ